MKQLIDEDEYWLPFVLEPRYEVSSRGRLRSWKPGAGRDGRSRRPRQLRGHLLKSGHRLVSLQIDGRRRDFYLHQIVAWTFIGPQPDGLVIRHLNGDPDDNRPENLCYGGWWDNYADNWRAAFGGNRNQVPVFLDAQDIEVLEQVSPRLTGTPAGEILSRLVEDFHTCISRSQDKLLHHDNPKAHE